MTAGFFQQPGVSTPRPTTEKRHTPPPKPGVAPWAGIAESAAMTEDDYIALAEDVLKQMRPQTERDREMFQQGREDCAQLIPLLEDEAMRRGWDACLNAIAWRLRERARNEPALRSALLEVLDGTDV